MYAARGGQHPILSCNTVTAWKYKLVGSEPFRRLDAVLAECRHNARERAGGGAVMSFHPLRGGLGPSASAGTTVNRGGNSIVTL